MIPKQKGFTLIEIVLAIGIVGAIVVVVAMTVTTLLLNSQQSSTQQILLQQVKNAGHWIPRDINSSSNVTLSAPNGFPITVNIPVDQDVNHDYTVHYLFDGNTLKREQRDSSGNLTVETLIAQYVDTDNTTCDNVTAGSYKLTIRVYKDEEAVTASYEAHRRLAALSD